ncbi:ABC transporter substrate-binding protein [Spongiactinospora sp. TRM90649]|uniref:ABC transporter substrate-binding protein n=1 Tax=Spongiactinospora sp. TRM90649 TaxID=3031114 RepID=UPI0023F9F8AA|nr:ABC transporter substrate-binding protein [Spongiactinospora sp. TRM90649]MDF5754334.1 ABC transporter substrate-binding protein [Spongiactinospora sp. TRM90649]
MRTKPIVAVAAALLALSTACSSATGERGEPNSESSTAAAGKLEQTVACPPAEKGAIDENATFTWMYSVANTSFDPDKVTTSNSWMYLFPVYDTLTRLDASGDPQPMLAKEWKIGDGGKSLTLELIKDWKYHDGTPFDAKSVKANIDRHRAKGTFNEQALSDVREVEVVGPQTVKIGTGHGAAPLISILASSAGMMMSPAVFDDPGQANMPTGGSGAFKVTGYEPATKVEYTAVDGYWDPEALNVAKMVFLISSSDNARLNAVITGQADVTFLRSAMYAPAKDAGLVICQKPSLASFTIALNASHAPFDKKAAREAMNYAIDRESINELQGGFCQPGIQMFPTSYYASDPNLTADKYAYDPAKAKELLKAAGVPDGFEFTLETDNLDAYTSVAELIQANLQQVGIKMKIQPVELPKLMENFSVNKTADAVMVQQKADADPSIQIASYYLSNGFSNPGGYSNAKVVELDTQAKAAQTREERSAIYKKLFQETFADAAPPVTLCHLNTPLAMNDKVMGLEVYVDGSRQFRGVAIKK